MTCEHGFMGACAECDGAGQEPEPEPTEQVGLGSIETYDDFERALEALAQHGRIDALLEQETEQKQVPFWTPESPDRANWCLQKLAGLDAEAAEIEEVTAREMARIDLWRARQLDRQRSQRHWLENGLRTFAETVFQQTGKQSVSLPHGRTQLRKAGWKLRLAAEGEQAYHNARELVIEWLKAYRPELIEVKETPRIVEIKKLVAEPHPGEIRTAIVAETGEEIPGLVTEMAEGMTFLYKTAQKESE